MSSDEEQVRGVVVTKSGEARYLEKGHGEQPMMGSTCVLPASQLAPTRIYSYLQTKPIQSEILKPQNER